MNKLAQTESGSLQNIMIALLVTSAIAVLLTGYIGQLANNYGVTSTETNNYLAFQKFNDTNSQLEELTDVFVSEEGNQNAGDIITLMLIGGYQFLLLVFQLPVIAVQMLQAAALVAGVPAIVVNLVTAIIGVIILFAVVALIMKVRA